MNQVAFGAFISSLRKEQNLTQKELGELLHISDKAISKWERGISVPDISMIEELGRVLKVSPLEIIQGKRFLEEKISKKDAEEAIHETVIQAAKQEKRKKRTLITVFSIIIVFLLFLLFFGRVLLSFMLKKANDSLDAWAEANETLYHTCEITPIYETDDGCGFYVYREQIEEHLWNYHVVSVDKEGNEKDLFVLQEKGMDLDTSPKLMVEGNVIYVLFGGIDNEDLVERVYSGKVGAEPQGFMPHLYKYDKITGVVEQIEIKDKTETLLMDVFRYGDNDIAVSEKFKGVFGGLHLGFYIGDRVELSNSDKEYDNLFGDGGLNSIGFLQGDNYYISGQNGIYGIDLTSGEGAYILEKDNSLCYRNEVKAREIDGIMYFVETASYMDQLSEVGEAITAYTEVTIYTQAWEKIRSISVPVGISAVEWGNESLIISGALDKKTKESYYVDLAQGKATLIEQSLDLLLSYRLDIREIAEQQWVYLQGENKYYLTGSEKFFLEER